MKSLNNPTLFDDALELSRQTDLLDSYLRARLVQLTTGDNAVALRAIEMLLNLPPSIQQDGDLSGISTSDLYDIRRRAHEYIRQNAGNATSETGN